MDFFLGVQLHFTINLKKKIRVFCQYEFPYYNDMITDAAHPAAFSFLPACVRATNTGKVRLLYFVVLFMILSILQKMVFFTSELR